MTFPLTPQSLATFPQRGTPAPPCSHRRGEGRSLPGRWSAVASPVEAGTAGALEGLVLPSHHLVW